jgi:phage terminase large subunit-like protein
VNYVQEYIDKIKSGEILVPKKIRKWYVNHIEPIINDLHPKYYFNEVRGERFITFAEDFCRQSKGEWSGQRIELMLFQKAKYQSLFGILERETNRRRFHEVFDVRGRKNGKALSLDTPILTTSGWKSMSEIEVGDFVFGASGNPVKVINTSEVFYNHQCFEVVFEDGEKIIADADHIWTVVVRKSKRGYQNVTTKEMVNDFVHLRKDGKGKEYKYRVPLAKPLVYSHKSLPIDPYLLGVWLGDGSKNEPEIYTNGKDVKHLMINLQSSGFTLKYRSYGENKKIIDIGKRGCGYKNPFTTLLREYNLENNKHIPDVYFQSSYEQRMQLLQGLMDTDAYCEKHGQVEFVQQDKNLTNQVSELLASLGIKHTIRDKQVTLGNKHYHAYSILFFVDKSKSCFKLQRHHQRLKDALAPRMRNKSIVDIRQVTSVPTKCITVDSSDHLYLAGRRLTVTHNSTENAVLGLYQTYMEDGAEVYVAATVSHQARRVWEESRNMIEQDDVLQDVFKTRQFPSATIEAVDSYSTYKYLSKNVKTFDSFNVSTAIIDEVHELSRDIYDLLKQGTSSRQEPLISMISTAGFVREGLFDDKYEYAEQLIDGTLEPADERLFPLIYELDKGDDYTDESVWIKANPGLGVIKNVETLRDFVIQAQNEKNFQATVKTKDFNIVGLDNKRWLEVEDIDNPIVYTEEELKKFDNTVVLGGFDLSRTNDITAFGTLLFDEQENRIIAIVMFWVTSKYYEEQIKTNSPVPWKAWLDRGLIRISGTDLIDYHDVANYVASNFQQRGWMYQHINYDRYSANYLIEELASMGYAKGSCLIPTAQGAITLSVPMQVMESHLKSKVLCYQNNPVLKWMFTNIELVQDRNGNYMPKKAGDKRGRKIDGPAVILNAYVSLCNNMEYFMSK